MIAKIARFIVAVIAAYVAAAALAMVLYSYIFSDQFKPLAELFRSAEQQEQTIIWAQFAQFVRLFLFGGILILLRGAQPIPLRLGAFYGMLTGLFAGTFHVANTASLPLPASTGIAWVAFDTILLTVAGLVFALVYRPQQVESRL